jgi:hypothetical protein
MIFFALLFSSHLVPIPHLHSAIFSPKAQCQFDSLWSPHGGLSAGPTPTVLFCEKGPIRFEMEVTHVPAAAAGAPAGEQHVVRMKRVSGDSWAYKNLCNRIIPQLRL